MTAFLVIKAIQTPRTCVIYSKGCYKELLAIFRAVSFFFLQFWLIFYVDKETSRCPYRAFGCH
jgi:hypothetical protein